MVPSFFKSLFKNNIEKKASALPAEFPAYVAVAINLLKTGGNQLTDEEAIRLFTSNNIPEKEAEELLTFLPIAFCRNALTVIDWPDHYFNQVLGGQFISVKYQDNPRFVAIQAVITSDLIDSFAQDDIVRIASRSASFQAINALLLTNPGGKLEGLVMTPEHILLLH